MTPKWTIRLLGAFEIERNGHPLPESVWHTQQAKQILKILVLARGRPVPAERLIEWLWPDSNPTASATTLRSTIHALRRVLEPERAPRTPARYVVTRSPGYAFTPDEDVRVDVYMFEDLLDQAAQVSHPGYKRQLLEQALALYRGDLLEEDPYAEWVLAERERLRERYLDALLALAELYAQADELERAIAACRRALARDEYREAAYRALMRYQVMAGDVAAALNTYERCRRILAEEFGAAPAPQTQALYEAIVRGEISTSSTTPTNAPAPSSSPRAASITRLPAYALPFGAVFVGRTSLADTLHGAIARAQKGQGGMIAITGEMGIGKTHLVLHVLQQWEGQVDIVGTRCLAIEHPLPFAPLIHALRYILDNLPTSRLHHLPPFALAQAALFIPSLHYRMPHLPAVPHTTPDEDRTRLIDGLANLLVALSDQRPLVLFFDDIQWADEGTLAVLGRLAYRATRHPLLLMVTYPPDALAENRDLDTLVVQLHHDGVCTPLRVDALSREEITQFLAHVWRRSPSEVADLAEHVYAQTEGVPLYVVEVVRETLSRHEELPRPEHIPPVQNLHHVRTLVLNRLSRLPRAAQDVLQLAAVMGRTFSLEVLETAAPFDPLPGLEWLLKLRFLQEDAPGQLSFTHEVVRQVIYTSLSTLARRRWHQHVAEALVALYGDQGAHVVQVAYHYRHAGPRHVLAALRYTVLAGDHLRHTYGFRQACDHYRRALQLVPARTTDPDVRRWARQAYLGLGLAYEAQGDWEGIVSTYTAMRQWAEAHGDDNLALLAARRLVVALTAIGRLSEAATTAGDVLAASSEHDEPIHEVFQRLQLVFAGERPAPVETRTDWPDFVRSAPLVGEPWTDVASVLGGELAALPLALYGWSLALQGHLAAADACLAYTIALAEEHNQVSYAVLAHHFRAHVHFLRDAPDRMQEHLDMGFRLARRTPNAGWSTWWAQVFEGYVHLHAGQVRAARQQFRAVDQALADRAAFRSHRLSAWVGLALAAVREHQIEEAIARLDQVLAEWEMLDAVTAFWAHVAAAAVARHRQRWQEAEHHARAALAFAGRRGLLFEYVAATAEVMRLYTARDRVDAVVPLLSRVETIVHVAQVPAVTRAFRSLQDRLPSSLRGSLLPTRGKA